MNKMALLVMVIIFLLKNVESCSDQCSCSDSQQVAICIITECMSLDLEYVNQLTVYGKLCPYLRNYLVGRYGYITLYDDYCLDLPKCR